MAICRNGGARSGGYAGSAQYPAGQAGSLCRESCCRPSDDAQRLTASHQINAVLALSARTLKIFQQLLTRYGLWHHHRQMHLIAASEQIIGSVTSEFASTELVNPAASGGYLEQLAGIIDSLPDS